MPSGRTRLTLLCLTLALVAGASAGLMLWLYPRGGLWFGPSTEPQPYPITSPAQRAVVKVEGGKMGANGINAGSGVIFAPGRILTAWHVLDDCDTARVTLADGDQREVLGVLSGDEPTDLLVLAYDHHPDDPTLELTDILPLPDERVTVIPSNHLYQPPPPAPIIRMGPDPEYALTVWITQGLSSGMSGSPALDENGEVFGIAVGSGDSLGMISSSTDTADPFTTADPVPLKKWMDANASGLTRARSIMLRASGAMHTDLELATELADRAIQLAPESYEVQIHAAEVFIEAGRIDDAEELLSRSTVQQFGYDQMYLEALLIAARKGWETEPDRVHCNAIMTHPDQRAAWAYMLVMAGRDRQAFDHARAVVATEEISNNPPPPWTEAFTKKDPQRIVDELAEFALESARINAGIELDATLSP